MTFRVIYITNGPFIYKEQFVQYFYLEIHLQWWFTSLPKSSPLLSVTIRIVLCEDSLYWAKSWWRKSREPPLQRCFFVTGNSLSIVRGINKRSRFLSVEVSDMECKYRRLLNSDEIYQDWYLIWFLHQGNRLFTWRWIFSEPLCKYYTVICYLHSPIIECL